MTGAISEANLITPDTVEVKTTPCPFCGSTTTFVLGRHGYERWQRGAHIQDVFPELSADDRETLISGACGPCFDKAFG